jgi:hypothetical protein
MGKQRVAASPGAAYGHLDGECLDFLGTDVAGEDVGIRPARH